MVVDNMRKYFCLILIALLSQLYCPIEKSFATQSPVVSKSVSVTRNITLTIKVVFIGPYFNPEIINVTVLESLLPKEKAGIILMDERNTGVIYKFNYEFAFAPQQFMVKLIRFLLSIEKKMELENPWFYTFAPDEEWFISKPVKIRASIYDAESVERWLIEHLNEIDGLSERDGYTFVIMDLRDLPSVTYNEIRAFLETRTFGFTPPSVKAHYYGINRVDFDRGYKLKFREFAVGWGGSERLWFIDLSAGPTFVSMWYDLPLQVIMEDQSINPYSDAGALWLTEFLADYIWEFIYNLAAPDFVYDPPWSEKIKVKIAIIDCREELEKANVPIESTVNLTLIKRAVSDLLPLSEVDVEAVFLNITDFPELNVLINKYSGKLDSWMHKYLFLSPMNISYVDAQPIYEYLKRNLDLFMPEISGDRSEYIVPVIAFAFSQDKHFMFKYKWLIAGLNPESGAIWGISFREFALIGLSYRDFLYGEYAEPKQEGKGLGFSQVIIHEIGHMLGLAHPHTYGDLGDFVSSAMSYFSYEYKFSIFDKDALARIHTDKLLMKAYRDIMEAKEKLPLKLNLEETKAIEGIINETEKLIDAIEQEYLKMNYVNAWEMVLKACEMAYEILGNVEALPSISREITMKLEEKELEIKHLNEKYSSLLLEYENLLSINEELSSELGLFKNLTILLSIITISFAATTIFFAVRKRKLSPKPPKIS